jgi:HSP20 family molecular chaperone IbpA
VHIVDDAFKKMADQLGLMIDEMMEGNLFRSSAPDSWNPAVNVYELPDRFVACVELAGMAREQIDVVIDDAVLHVRGTRPKPSVPGTSGPVSVHVMEIDSGKFHRKVPVPADVRVEQVRAVYRRGYLWVDLPRAQPAAADNGEPTT